MTLPQEVPCISSSPNHLLETFSEAFYGTSYNKKDGDIKYLNCKGRFWKWFIGAKLDKSRISFGDGSTISLKWCLTENKVFVVFFTGQFISCKTSCEGNSRKRVPSRF